MDYDEPRRGRGRGRGRGRPRGRSRGPQRNTRLNKRNKIESDEEEEEISRQIIIENHTPSPPPQPPSPPPPLQAQKFDQDCDISALEAPTFTTLDRGPPAPMLQLSWDHPVSLIGEKVMSPRIHTCDTCNKPILLYGRKIPCKHVFCLTCAKRDERRCSRCGETVARVEQTGLGTVFMCTFKISDQDCKRTYLSARDLQAHIDHRHKKSSGPPCPNNKEEIKEERISHRDPRGGDRPDPRVKDTFDTRPPFPSQFSHPGYPQLSLPSGSPVATHQIPVMTSARTNLITVPIQDPPDHPPFHNPQGPLPHQGNPQRPPLGAPSHMPPHMMGPGPPMPNHSFISPPPAPTPSSYAPPFSSGTSQYAYPPTTLPPPQGPPGSGPSPIYGGPPSGMPPSTFGNRPPQYENQYPPTQWSTPPPQGPPNRPPPHHPPPPPGQPNNYYR